MIFYPNLALTLAINMMSFNDFFIELYLILVKQ